MIEAALRYLKLNLNASRMDYLAGSQKQGFVTHLNNETGETHTYDHPPDRRCESAHTLDSLEAMVRDRINPEQAIRVFVSPKKIAVVSDYNDNRPLDVITMRIEPHNAFSILGRESERLLPKELSEFIRINLFDCGVMPADLSTVVAAVKISSSKNKNTNSGHGDEEMSISIKKEISGTNAIPEQATVTFQSYPMLDKSIKNSSSICCAVRIDTEEETISLIPMPGEIESCLGEAQEAIVEYLATGFSDLETVKVFAGTPPVAE